MRGAETRRDSVTTRLWRAHSRAGGGFPLPESRLAEDASVVYTAVFEFILCSFSYGNHFDIEV